MSYVVVKWRYHVDIRQYGSGTAGASNVLRKFSQKAGILIGLYDVFKGIVLMSIAWMLGMDSIQQAAIGIAVIIGHNWPFSLRFNGGRGVAATIGIALFLLPMGIPTFIFFGIFTLITGASALPVLLAIAALPLASWGMHEPLGLTLALTSIFLLMVVRRLTAPRSARAKSVNTRELLWNRFLYDRDIRDAKAWITYSPEKNEKPRRPD